MLRGRERHTALHRAFAAVFTSDTVLAEPVVRVVAARGDQKYCEKPT